VRDVHDGTGKIINSSGEVGGYPTLHSVPAASDADGDGMPDSWEQLHRVLNVQDPADGSRDQDRGGTARLAGTFRQRRDRCSRRNPRCPHTDPPGGVLQTSATGILTLTNAVSVTGSATLNRLPSGSRYLAIALTLAPDG